MRHGAPTRDVYFYLHSLFKAYGHLSCTNRHDHVYGLLGIFRYITRVQDLPDCLQPNYRQDPLRTILIATRHVIVELQQFRIEEYVTYRSDVARQLPSWAWDWTSPPPPPPPPGIDESSVETPFTGRLPFTPACGAREMLRFLSAPSADSVAVLSTLQVEGIPLGRLAHLTAICAAPLTGVLTQVNQLLRETSAITGNVVRDDDLAEVLIAGYNENDAPATKDDLAKLADYRALLASPAHESSRAYVALEPSETQHAPLSDGIRRGREFEAAMQRICPQRRIFATDRGRVGLGPRTAEIGDHLVILAGCAMPVVIRAQGVQWRVVGPA